MTYFITHFYDQKFIAGLTCGIVFGFAIFYKRRTHKILRSTKEISDEVLIGEDSNRYKLVLVVRNDLKMGKGKAAAQCSHASVLAYEQAKKRSKNVLLEWKHCGQPKVVVKVDSEKELDEVASSARKLGIITSVIRDAGRTQIAPNSKTVVGIGPGPIDLIDSVTGHLKLY